MKKKGKGRLKRVEDPHRINQKITADPVRLVGDNVNNDIYSLEEALKIAEEQELDLVEVSERAVPPVCKVMDYRKFLFEQKKKAKELKAKAAKVDVKEIRFGPNTDDHDINFKVKHAIKFFEEGYKVRAYVFFRGRSIVFADRGEDLLRRFVEKLEDYAKLEQEPKMEGKKLIILLAPK